MSINANVTQDALFGLAKPAVAVAAPAAPAPKSSKEDERPSASFSKTINDEARKQAQADKPTGEPEKVSEPTDTAKETENSGNSLPPEELIEFEAEDETLVLDLTLDANSQEELIENEEALVDVATRFVFEALPRETRPVASDDELLRPANLRSTDLLAGVKQKMMSPLSDGDIKLTAERLATDLGAEFKQTLSGTIERADTQAQQNSPKILPAQSTVEMNIPTKVGSNDWGESVAGRITMLVSQRMSSARIQLTPAELGPIEVRVNTNGDQASVQFLSHSSQVREMLEQSMPRLREMLEAAGFSLADSDVSDQAKHSDGESGSSADADTNVEEDVDSSTAERSESVGLVDQFV